METRPSPAGVARDACDIDTRRDDASSPTFDQQPQRPPRTAIVVGAVVATAAMLSYLLTYAMTNALVAAEVLAPWKAEHDPRPLWFALTLGTLIGVFLMIAAVARHVSSRQLRAIDAIDAIDSTSDANA